MKIGCPSLIVSRMADERECDHFRYLTYVVGSNSRPKALFRSFMDNKAIRVFRSSNGNRRRGKYFPKSNNNRVVYRYDGLYFVSGATDEKGHEVSKSLHGDAIVFYMIRCEAFECLERLYQQYPEMQYSILCHEHRQHGSNMLSSEEILVDIEEFNVNHFLDWSPNTVGV